MNNYRSPLKSHPGQSRQKLPPAPLVLQPILAQAKVNTRQAQVLLTLAAFLEENSLLTDGGSLNLARGLVGRKNLLSLTGQDVRAWAHALALELWSCADLNRWKGILSTYYASFDRGKRRRPNRLQRLYLEWSADYGPLGLLEAVQRHPYLIPQIESALQTLPAGSPDHLIFTIFFQTSRSASGSSWHQAFKEQPSMRKSLLSLLPLLAYPSYRERLQWLDNAASTLGLEDCEDELWLASRRPLDCQESPWLPASLFALLLAKILGSGGQVEARWLAVLRGYRLNKAQLERLEGAILVQDPVRKIAFGPGRNRLWWQELFAELCHDSTPLE